MVKNHHHRIVLFAADDRTVNDIKILNTVGQITTQYCSAEQVLGRLNKTTNLANELFYLLLSNFHVADSDGTAIVVDAPAVFLDAVDALCIGADIVDVERQN